MPNHSELLSDLRRAGYRLTPQRESVLAVMVASQAHLTAEQILARVRHRYPYLNKSAVYRALAVLTRLDIVTETDLGQGRVEYELHAHPHHHHLICRGCGDIVQVDDRCLRSLHKGLRENYGFQADLAHLAIFGWCRDCRDPGTGKRIKKRAGSIVKR